MKKLQQEVDKISKLDTLLFSQYFSYTGNGILCFSFLLVQKLFNLNKKNGSEFE